uniref:DNA topoisomerase (ATP-hydrolyzing) n=1 Tax=viral metagenome TaxID=1070528 RepID=A0A6C0BSM3_9ZZZZ
MAELANKYQKKTDKQHILDNPDTYIGSVENIDAVTWVCKDGKIVKNYMNYIPGLYKLFDEGIVNCRDHVIRMKQAITDNKENSIPVSNINISISEDGTITMINDGNGIDIEKHPEYNVWIPELVFGHLRTSTNYNKDEKKIVGGKNGFGFKLVLIWSIYGYIETVDHVRKKKYCQEFKQNLDVTCDPVITKCSVKPYTKIVFKPDYTRFGIENLSQEMRELLTKRVYDISAVTDKNIKVKFNDSVIPVKNFQQYIDLYLEDNNKKVYEEGNDRWEYAAALSSTHEFQQVSFVNGICTFKGGKHVEYILNQITKKMVSYIEKKKKVTVTANSIKEQIILFVRCDIENPAFDSQTKDYLNTPISKFGSSCNVTDKFIDKLAKQGIMDAACEITNLKDNKAAKKSDGKKSKNIRGIPKLIDANWAGTTNSHACTIIFCEGDSAKAGIVSGLSTEDRNIIGVYPMKGKVLNVRGETQKKINDNKEIIEIKKILGLETGKKYSEDDIKKHLRYGRVLFMTDQDLDGSHIKGLGINLFQSEWETLSQIPGFIGFMNTPILKAKKGSQELLFYNDGEYKKWKDENHISGWKIKYYKGLGTSTGSEFKEYFQNKKIVTFAHTGETSSNSIDKVFNKKRADDRKLWLADYDRECYLDTNQSSITYDDFIDKEMIHFSKYDCDRSIPNVMDGLKISLRKILYSSFKKNLNSEIKVAQFSGYVSEHSGYHHGEASLNAAIVGLAQNYIGSNNINLFSPNGQFGTRLQGGKDSASERYIFTQLNKITRFIFNQQDDAILKYLDDDGFPVEPIYYMPIIPMVLVNGSKGIGTGFSTEILSYNVKDIIKYLKYKLTDGNDGENITSFVPYYEGFTGFVVPINDQKYLIKGKYEIINDITIHISELPIGTWTDDYKQFLETLMETTDAKGKKITPIIKDFSDMSKSTNIDIHITFHNQEKLYKLLSTYGEYGVTNLEKTLKLITTVTTTNMHMFDHNEKLKKYQSVPEIINDYYDTRLTGYITRKDHMISNIRKELILLSNKKRYIQELLDDTIDLRKKKKEIIIQLLKDKEYDIIDNDCDYKYLLKMSMDSVTEENVEKLTNEHTNKVEQLQDIISTSVETMWINELELLEDEYDKFLTNRIHERENESGKKKKMKVKK